MYDTTNRSFGQPCFDQHWIPVYTFPVIRFLYDCGATFGKFEIAFDDGRFADFSLPDDLRAILVSGQRYELPAARNLLQ
jgi:hypothetical protein